LRLGVFARFFFPPIKKKSLAKPQSRKGRETIGLPALRLLTLRSLLRLALIPWFRLRWGLVLVLSEAVLAMVIDWRRAIACPGH